VRQEWKRTETRKVVWLENLMERDDSKCIGVHGSEVLKIPFVGKIFSTNALSIKTPSPNKLETTL
jgi:hypothetical protein